MNKTEYMNTLNQALQGLPAELIEQTMWAYDKKFADGLASGSSEADVIAKLANPRVVAAQKRADLRLQKLKGNFSVSNFARMIFAMVGLIFFNFFMLIPAFLGGILMFSAYLISMVIYGTGVVVLAASLSGVPEMQFKFPGTHSHHHNYQSRHFGQASVHLNANGITVDQPERHDRSTGFDDAIGAPNTVTISNHLGAHHFFAGAGLLLLGTVFLLLCLQMTRLSFIGFKNYLQWNLSLLRMPSRV